MVEQTVEEILDSVEKGEELTIETEYGRKMNREVLFIDDVGQAQFGEIELGPWIIDLDTGKLHLIEDDGTLDIGEEITDIHFYSGDIDR